MANPQPLPGELGLSRLNAACVSLQSARESALEAAEYLEGARKRRAKHFAEELADLIDYAGRLAFCVEGDLRADRDWWRR
jgi:hypothetical protein